MLTISIPTKNKKLLVYNIKKIINFLQNKSINILICDNSQDDEIQNIYKIYKKEYQNIYYKKNKKDKNFDINCFNALNIPETKYVWVIGDGLIIKENKVEKILKVLEKNYDIIIYDYSKRIKNKRIKEFYSKKEDFFKDLSWHITLLGSTILKKEYIKYSLGNFSEKYVGTFFMHLGILLESVSNKEFKAIVIKEEVCENNPLKKASSWSNLTFDTFCDGWIKFIELLPDIYVNQKEYVIKSHGVKSKLFSIKFLFFLRARYDEYSVKKIYQNRKKLKRVTNVPILIMYLIWVMPKCILNIPIKILEKIRRRKYSE
ncbi:MAG: glycosyltransferase [Fusobacteriaceae bacterium]